MVHFRKCHRETRKFLLKKLINAKAQHDIGLTVETKYEFSDSETNNES